MAKVVGNWGHMGMEKDHVVMEEHRVAIPSENTKEKACWELWESIIRALDVGAENLTLKIFVLLKNVDAKYKVATDAQKEAKLQNITT